MLKRMRKMDFFSFFDSPFGTIHLLSTHAKFSEKLTFVRARMCAYQAVRNVSFSENLTYVLNE